MLPLKECFHVLAECQLNFPCGVSSLTETLRKLICPMTDQAFDVALLIWLNQPDCGANAITYLHQNRLIG